MGSHPKQWKEEGQVQGTVHDGHDRQLVPFAGANAVVSPMQFSAPTPETSMEPHKAHQMTQHGPLGVHVSPVDAASC